jgi:catechol 2,3-dioxygenase-like lactoylglutathione lyase family enzyme
VETTMIRVRDIDHVVIRTDCLEAMLRFYVDVLGCPVERRLDDVGLIQLRAGSSLIDLVPVDSLIGRQGGPAPVADGHNMDHFCLRVEPFEEAQIRQHLKLNGIDPGPTETRYGAEGSGPSIYVRDPGGNTVELKGPPNV